MTALNLNSCNSEENPHLTPADITSPKLTSKSSLAIAPLASLQCALHAHIPAQFDLGGPDCANASQFKQRPETLPILYC